MNNYKIFLGTFFLNGLLFASQPQEKGWLEEVDLKLVKLPSAEDAVKMMKDGTGKKIFEKSYKDLWDSAHALEPHWCRFINPDLRSNTYSFLYSLVRNPQNHDVAAQILNLYLSYCDKHPVCKELGFLLMHASAEAVNVPCMKLLLKHKSEYAYTALKTNSEWVQTPCNCPPNFKLFTGVSPLMIIVAKPESPQATQALELLLDAKARFDKTMLNKDPQQRIGTQPWARTQYNAFIAKIRDNERKEFEKQLKDKHPEIEIEETPTTGILSASIGAAPALEGKSAQEKEKENASYERFTSVRH